jgi:hypothetical protein
MLLKRLIFYFSNVYICFSTSLKGKVKRAKVFPPPRHALACRLTCLWQWFYLIFIYMSSFIIILLLPILIYFIIVFVCRALRPPNPDRRPFLGLCTTRVNRRWAECGRRGRRFPRLPRSRRSAQPSRRLPRSSKRFLRSRTSRTRLVTSHWSPIG